MNKGDPLRSFLVALMETQGGGAVLELEWPTREAESFK